MTLAARILHFMLALGILGAFWLPWVRVDGMQARNGIELIVLAVTPSLKYLLATSSIGTGFLIGCPVGILLFGILVVARYVQKKTAIFFTVAVLAVAVALPYGSSELLADSEPGFLVGLKLILVLASVLLVHQILIKVSTSLRTRYKFPALYRTLAAVTGSGYYRWREG